MEQVDLPATDDLQTRHKWVMAGCYFCICFVLSLRGSEGLLADLEGMLEYFLDDKPHVVIPRLGRFKGEDHSSQHLMQCVSVTDSGIQVKVWLVRVMAIHRALGQSTGPMFIKAGGNSQSTTSDMNVAFLECLADIFERKPELFPVDTKTVDDLADKFNVFRSFRRGSESRATAMKVSETDCYVVNRWRKKEAAGASRVNHPIGQHYVDVSLVTPSFLRYTKAM